MEQSGKPDVMQPPVTDARRHEQEKHADSSSASMNDLLEELRMMRREQRHEDFSFARLAAAVAQAFALCAIGWGLFAWIDASPDQIGPAATAATIRLLAGIAFQVMALTLFVASKK